MSSRYCEPWIESKLFERLSLYKKRYPLFDVDRVMGYFEKREEKYQRWAPYMQDKDIQEINKSLRKSRSIGRLATLDNW